MFRGTGLRFLLPYMRPYRGHLLLGTLYAMIGAAASAFSPTLLGMAIDAFEPVSDAYAQENLRYVLLSNAITPLPNLVVRLASTLVLAIAGVLIISNQLTIGQYVQFIVYLGL